MQEILGYLWGGTRNTKTTQNHSQCRNGREKNQKLKIKKKNIGGFKYFFPPISTTSILYHKKDGNIQILQHIVNTLFHLETKFSRDQEITRYKLRHVDNIFFKLIRYNSIVIPLKGDNIIFHLSDIMNKSHTIEEKKEKKLISWR